MASFPVLLYFMAVFFPLLSARKQESSFDALSTTQKNIQEEIVNKHNELRRSVFPTASNMLKMTWSNEAAANAQKWADKCTLSHSPSEQRKISTSGCGENLFMSSNADPWSVGIQNWYNEYKSFTYGIGPKTSNAMIGHYTQIAWYSSSVVGCGVAYCPNQDLKYYFVCHYCPPGNIQGKIHVPYLSGPPCAACPNNCENGLCTNSCKYTNVYSNCDSLVKSVGCEHAITKENCLASCKCKGKIY
ncbi:CAP domain-containing protein [Salmonella enterica]|nr:CAP domain-containing protein [Salmonella enterica]